MVEEDFELELFLEMVNDLDVLQLNGQQDQCSAHEYVEVEVAAVKQDPFAAGNTDEFGVGRHLSCTVAKETRDRTHREACDSKIMLQSPG